MGGEPDQLRDGTRTAGVVRVIGRMKPNVTVPQLQTQMDALATDLRAAHVVKRNAGVYINVVAMHDTLVSDVKVSILALMGAVIFVLLIACANLANLTMTQSARRERDLAVRAALGAGRGALVRQMLIESLVLAVVGAAAGLALARLGIVVLQEIGPANLPRLQDVAIDLRVLGFTAAAAILSAILFGLLPAFRASRLDVTSVLRRTGRVAGLGHGQLRNGLVVVEVALTFVLLIGSGPDGPQHGRAAACRSGLRPQRRPDFPGPELLWPHCGSAGRVHAAHAHRARRDSRRQGGLGREPAAARRRHRQHAVRH